MRDLTDKDYRDILTETLEKIDEEIKIEREVEANCRGHQDLTNSMYLHLGSIGALEGIKDHVAELMLKRARTET